MYIIHLDDFFFEEKLKKQKYKKRVIMAGNAEKYKYVYII